MTAKMVKLTIDGAVIDAHEGDNLLNVALQHGIKIPHFCYHPALKVAGNCRMCLVEIDKMPKLQIACGTPIRDGLIVHTASERVIKARKTVMELLLINHPLDCPVCDQCGECLLQDHSFEHGKAVSRYHEKKRTYTKKSLGDLVVPEMNRCIHCTRCIRFLKDVAGSEEMGLSLRGEHTEVGSYLASALQSPFSMNVIDLCPVGALTSGPFRFKKRPWYMDKSRTICTGCARGCNVVAWHDQGVLYRIMPFTNDEVNQSWLCDEGRLLIGRIKSKDRLLRASFKGEPADTEVVIATAAQRIQEVCGSAGYDSLAIVVSGRLANEDLFLLGKLVQERLSGAKIYAEATPDDDKPFGPINEPLPTWFIRNDRTANSWAVKTIIGRTAGTMQDLATALKAGKVKAAALFDVDLLAPGVFNEEIRELLLKLPFSLACGTHSNVGMTAAQALLPMAHAYEKEGTVVNEGGRLQKLAQVVPAAPGVLPAWRIIAKLAEKFGANWKAATAGQVFAQLAKQEAAFSGMVFENIPPEGVVIKAELTK